MKKALSCLVAAFALALAMVGSQAQAQSRYSQRELDALLAPIALYPDELLTQVLIAATYPEDVADARAYLDSHPSLQQSSVFLAREVSGMPWDDSVKSLAQFPSVLAMLDDQPEWTDAIGYAFLYQRDDVMRTIQRLRFRAREAGYLVTNSQQIVDVQRDVIVILPTRESYYYVPYYDPYVVYGRWWWPGWPPYYWEPPPRYRPPGYSVVNGIFFGVGVGIVRSIFFPVRPDWRHRRVIIFGGPKPGLHWQWKPRPPRPGIPGRPGRPNRPPTTKPVLKPLPPRTKPSPTVRPPTPAVPGRPGQPVLRPQRPSQGAKPAPVQRPARPPRPEARPAPTSRPAPKPSPAVTKPPATITPPVTRPRPARPVTKPPVTPPRPERPVTAPPASPITKPVGPGVPPDSQPQARPLPKKPEGPSAPTDKRGEDRRRHSPN